MNALWFLIKTVGSLLAMAFMLRAYMHWLGMSNYDPIAQFVIALTDWLVKPLRRIFPSLGNIDWASLFSALIVSTLLAVIGLWLSGGSVVPAFGIIVLTGVVWLIGWAIWLMIMFVIIHIVLSWVNPHAPIAPTIDGLTRPLLGPVRRLIPLVGGVDLSPMVVLIGLFFLRVLLSGTFGSYLVGPI